MATSVVFAFFCNGSMMINDGSPVNLNFNIIINDTSNNPIILNFLSTHGLISGVSISLHFSGWNSRPLVKGVSIGAPVQVSSGLLNSSGGTPALGLVGPRATKLQFGCGYGPDGDIFAIVTVESHNSPCPRLPEKYLPVLWRKIIMIHSDIVFFLFNTLFRQCSASRDD